MLAYRTVATVQPGLAQGIRNQKQRIAGSFVAPIAQGVAADGQHRNTRRQVEAVLAAVGVVSNPTASEPLDQTGHIKAPADHPENLGIRGLQAKAVVQVRMVG